MTTLYIVLGIVLCLVVVAGVVLFVMVRLGGTVEAEVYAAIERGEYQFVALMESDGTMTYPKVEGIPDWYLEVSGLFINRTSPETKEQDLAHMKRYNDLMYETLKEEGKLHLIEEQVEIVRKNLGKAKA